MAAIFWGFPCVDPLSLRAHCAERGIPHDRWSAKANTFATGPGPRYGRGWVLLKKKHLDALGSAATDTLVFSGTDAAHVVTLKSVVPVAQECVTPGSGADPEAVYLLEVADRRIHLARKPTDRAFNLRKADGTGNYTNTLNSGSAWTWQQAVDALAGDAGLSTPLTLPFTPDASPANLVYWGHPSALEALCDLLDRLACALCYDPTTDAFSVARLGESSVSNLSAADAAAGGARLWDGYSEQYDRAAVPETIRVRFPRRPVDRTDGDTPYYFVDVATGVAGATAGTVTQIDDDLSALATTGAPSNTAALATRAAERAADWVRKRRYYDQPVLRAWRDFVPTAAGLGGNAVRRVVFDDRAQLQTWAESGYGYEAEDWRPLGGWPVWWPFELTESTGGGSSFYGQPFSTDGEFVVWNGETGSWVRGASGLRFTTTSPSTVGANQSVLTFNLPGENPVRFGFADQDPSIAFGVTPVSVAANAFFSGSPAVDRALSFTRYGTESDSASSVAWTNNGQLVLILDSYAFNGNSYQAIVRHWYPGSGSQIARSSTFQERHAAYTSGGTAGLTAGCFNEGYYVQTVATITALGGGATLADTITKVNEIITRLQTAGIIA